MNLCQCLASYCYQSLWSPFYCSIFRLSKEELLQQLQMRLQDTGLLMTPILQVKCKLKLLVLPFFFFHKDLFTVLPLIWTEDEGLKSSCSVTGSSTSIIFWVALLKFCPLWLVLQLQITPLMDRLNFYNL